MRVNIKLFLLHLLLCLTCIGVTTTARADNPSADNQAAVSSKAADSGEGNNGAIYIGEQRCVACHKNEIDHYLHTTHSKAFKSNPKNELERRGCEACHGPGSKHAENFMSKNALASFTRESAKPGESAKAGIKLGLTRESGKTPDQLNEPCLQCHKGGQRIFWNFSTHQSKGVACTDCHNTMAKFSQTGLLKKASITETCYTCHQQQRSEFLKRSHMPLPEGKMSCEDCHNPHGSATKPLLKADSVNQLCYSCHAEKRGPFLWEHAPVKESCLNCHKPHGSNHEKLLSTPRPFLCQQCHSNQAHVNNLTTKANTGSGKAPDERVIGRSCSTCHAQVHGSNHPSGVRLHR
ncbi:MAG TPA: DmsE family decaheme c-type cytochrome [Noviherbaspirillum sp.]|nr:DmsE family decaheme c-type cytochrome [Noviherbaspirillum sp.]